MSEGQNNSPQRCWWQIFKKPSTIAVGSIAVACGVLGYVGARWLVTEKLPPFLEQQLSKTFERPLDLGEVASFSFNSITFGESSVSVNDGDRDYVIVEKVKVGFNILPVITRRVLPLKVTLIDPDVYLEQDENGTWLELPQASEDGRELPIDFDITVIAEAGEVALQPNSQDTPIELQLDGEVNYDQSQPEYIRYDLDAKTGEAIAKVKGETAFATGETKTQILLQDLSLSKVISLLPNKPPVNIQQGNLNADLDISIPSFKEINDTRIQGTASLQKFQATAEQLDKPVKAKSRLRFQDEKIKLNNTQASIGDVVANIDGRINWEKGYDVNIIVPSFAINKLQEIVTVNLLDAKGKMKANLQLAGAITEPVLKGTVSNTQPVTVAKTKLDEVEAELTASLEKVVLEEFRIIPVAGGEITGQGIIGAGSDKITASPIPLSLQFEANLPAEELLQPYYDADVPFNVGTLTAQAKVDGTIDNPEVLVDWQAPTVTTSAKTNVSGSGEIIYDNSILAINNTKIDIGSGDLNLSGTANLEENSWQGVLNASNVPLNPWLQPLESEQLKLGEPVTLSSGTVRLNGKLTPEIINTVDGVANLNFDVGSGDINLRSNINSGQLEVVANAEAVPADDFLTGVELSQPLDAQVDLSANLDSLENIAIDANNIAVQSGEQNLNGSGEIVVADSDLANVNLDLQADSNLSGLPNQLLSNISANNKFLAENFNLAGNASFDGRLQGKNILSQPDNLDLTGDLQLEDSSIGNTAFDNLLGTVNLSPSENITVDLQGEQDVIAVNLEPCTNKPCPVPYFPTDIEIRQGEDTPEPIVATANRQGDSLDIDVANFPLSILNLQAGVPGKIGGEITGDIFFNLFTFAATGEVRVTEPSIGYIDGEAITADFAYSPKQNLARLNTATVEFGESIYNLEGTYNLATQEIEGDLDIPQAYVQDLITALGWYDIERVTELFQVPDLADASTLSEFELGERNARVGSLIRLMVIVTERLEQMADDSAILAIPLDIIGAYQGEVAIAGSLNSPEVAWDIVGDDWLWDTRSDTVFEIPRRQGIIAIANLAVEGNYSQEAITFNTLSIQGTKSALSLNGKLQSEQVSADYDLQDIPIEAIQNFVDIPFEVAGRISTEGQISQTLQNPNFVGDVSLENGRLSDRSLPKIAGEYVYNNARLELDTTETLEAQIQASIPFPIEPGNDRVSIKADLDEGGVALIDGFTSGALEFIGGNADITLDATARLDLDADFIFQDLDAEGEASLKNTILQTAAFTEPLNVTAEIAIADGLIRVEQLAGIFAKSEIAASGVLPLLESSENISDPLTLIFQESEIDLDKLYKGGIEGDVIITGDAFSPLISGDVELFDGQAFVPEDEEEVTLDDASNNIEAAIDNGNNNTDPESAFTPKLEDLDVTLSDFRVQQTPLYKIVLGGGLILNGAANNVPEIKADGTLKLTRADVDFVSNEFNLRQDYENVVVFDPDTTILNPSIDVKLQTEVAELDDTDLSIINNNEIPDPISRSGRNEIVNVTLNIDGEAEQIIPRINEDANRNCAIDPPFNPLFESKIYKQDELSKSAECINSDAFKEGAARELLNSPAVELSSNPSRSQSAILSLLGNRFIGLAEQLQNSNEEELLEFGVTQFILTPVEREVFNFADGTINSIGKKIGLDYFQIYPNLKGTYQLTDDSSINTTYDYFFSEVKVRYQKQF